MTEKDTTNELLKSKGDKFIYSTSHEKIILTFEKVLDLNKEIC